MISTRPMIPMLTHVDNLGDINLDMTSQEQSLETIANNTSRISDTVNNINSNNETTEEHIRNIEQEMMLLNPNVSMIQSAVGVREDAATAASVIGLLKSIVNKLS